MKLRSQPPTRTDVTRFGDYRAFLLAHVQDCKRSNPSWSYGVWAKRLAVQDVSSITKIIQGQRDPGPTMLKRLIRYFEFTSKQSQYFEDLVRLKKIQGDPRLSVLLLEKMGKSHPNCMQTILSDDQFQIISNWYCTAIREMVRLEAFLEDPQWIAKVLKFKISTVEADRAISLLLKVGLLHRDQNGRLQIASGRYQTTSDYASEAVKRYHESMLDHAKTAIRLVAVENREFNATVIGIKQNRIEEAKLMIRDFQNQFSKILEECPSELVYQMQIQFFPLTRPVSNSNANNNQKGAQ